MKKIFFLMGTLLVLASSACGYFLYQNAQLYHNSLKAAEVAIAKKDYRNAAINVERALFIKKDSEDAQAYKEQLEPAMALENQETFDVDFITAQTKKILRVSKGSAELKAQAREMQANVAKLNEEKKEFQNNLTELQTALSQKDLLKAEAELTTLNKVDDQAIHLADVCQVRNTLALEFAQAVAKQQEAMQQKLQKAEKMIIIGEFLEANLIIEPLATTEMVKELANIQLQAKKLQGIIRQQGKLQEMM
ncbi:hypothetical protein EsVE80_04930 [Enterococcus saigonensis]|uniref:Lipoprotein n=1 Tax=Enterococcus saigonensis TaxID=1805431 RepID=A0A679I9A6_9ENTE|nr:oxidoreductase [Enterococcus saigonensis]BCA84970.1 hypothetical protein EsVE80_04930 [Enterococcus saigonensis]